jgi:hypothetical protein
MIHRTASACWVARASGVKPQVVHLLFGEGKHLERYRRAVDELKATVDPQQTIDFLVLTEAATPTAHALALYEAYKRKEPGIAEQVLQGILQEKLYTFASRAAL